MAEVIHHTVRRDYDDDEDIVPEPEDLLNEDPVTLETTFANVLVVDNLPVVTEEKFAKLEGIIKKIFAHFGKITPNGFNMPQDENKTTKGFAFVEFETRQSAENALAETHKHKLDAKHIFNVVKFDDFVKYEQVPEVYTAPKDTNVSTKDDLLWWLVHENTQKCIDQFAVRQGDLTEVYWNEATRPVLVADASRPKWTDTFVAWSPKGSYMATMHHQGVQIWGGPGWKRQAQFSHTGAKLLDFSPNENYLVTVSPQYAENDNKDDPKCIIVWDVRTGAKMRGFMAGPTSVWPAFHWSFDDKYFARMGPDVISVYETPSMGLIGKQSVKVPGVKDFAWSPSKNILSYFVPEKDAVPAKVVLLEIPSKKELRQKNLVSVADCKLHWQSKGKFLAVKVDQMKSKKTTGVNFELFRVLEKNIPVESLEIKNKVHAFAWEPSGNRFAIIHGEENVPRPDVSFYEMGDRQLKHLKTLEKKQANHLFWSPKGDHIVLAGLRNMNGVLDFFNVNEMESMGQDEHMMCTGVDWDPSGRYVATYVSYWRHQLDTGYHLYSFSGKPLYKVLKDRFLQFLWRPRPPTLLPQDKLTKLKKGLPAYRKKYELEEATALKLQEQKETQAKNDLRNAFYADYNARMAEYKSLREQYRALLGRDPDAGDKETEEVTVVTEELLDHHEEILD